MKRKLILIFSLVFHYCEYVDGLRLKKVLVLGRHSLRAPLYTNLEALSPNKWPKWSVELGQLTPKGELLEGYMGKYFSAWLHREGLLHDRCPDKNSVYLYSNYLNRTRATANEFSQAAFPNCNVRVHIKNVTYPFLQYDPVFSYRITNATNAYKESGTREMKENLNRSNLKDIYEILNNISDIRNSEICQNENFCDLTIDTDEIVFEFGGYPHISGRFKIGYLLVDSFLMSFYEGFPLKEVGWGGIENQDQLKMLTKIINEKMNIYYNVTGLREFIQPLLKYIKEAIEDEPLFTYIVGHDSTLATLMFSMGVNPYVLPEQLEMFPMGSKLVFQKWTDEVNDFLKVEYVYHSLRQIRDGQELSFANPPKNITMHFKTLTANENAMYSWSDFEKILNDLIQ